MYLLDKLDCGLCSCLTTTFVSNQIAEEPRPQACKRSRMKASGARGMPSFGTVTELTMPRAKKLEQVALLKLKSPVLPRLIYFTVTLLA